MVERLQNAEPLRVIELASKYNISSVQVREDLKFIEHITALRLERPHGEASLVNVSANSLRNDRGKEDWEEKNVVAAYAVASLFANGDHLLLDTGTQMEQFARHLAQERRNVTVATSAALFSEIFLPHPDIVFIQLGGVLNSRVLAFLDKADQFYTKQFFSTTADEFFRQFCYQRRFKAVITGTAFSSEWGLSVNSPGIISNKRSMINAAAEVIILLTHSKLIKTAPLTVTYCGMKQDDWLTESKPTTIVIDDCWNLGGEPPAFLEFLRSCNAKEIETPKAAKVRVFRTILHAKNR